MDGKDAKKETDTTTKKEKCKLGAHWKVVLGGIIALILIVLNTFWNMTENKISETIAKQIGSLTVAEETAKEIESLKAEIKSGLAKLDARVSETEKEKETIDLDAVKGSVESIRKAKEDFEKKLLAVVKAEELKLAALEKDAANQKAYIDELKGLLEGAK